MERKTFSKVKIYIRDSYNKAGQHGKAGNYDEAIKLLVTAVCDAPEVPILFERLREYEIAKCKAMNPAVKALYQVWQFIMLGPIAIKAATDPIGAIGCCERQLAGCVDQLFILKILASVSERAEAPWITVSALETIREFHPKDEANLRRLAGAMQLNNQAHEALSIHRKLAHGAPADLATQNELRSAMALASIQRGNYDESESDQASGKRNLADAESAVLQQLLEGTIHDADQAKLLIDKFTKDLETNDSIDMRRKLADAYMVIKDFAAAYDQYKIVGDKLGVIDPVLDKQIEQAYIAQLKQSIETLEADPQSYDNPQEQIAQFRTEIDAYRLRHAQKRAKDFPNDAQLQLDLGALYFERKEYDQAEAIIRATAEIPQTRRKSLVYLGQCAILRGAPEEAVKYLEEAVAEMYRVDKSKREALYYLGNACEACGNTERAVDCYRQISNSMANYRDVAARLSKLAPESVAGNDAENK
ncbi:MAG: tetratricopeptide repeat protein [Victivallaceae bacterium]|nr:tetratricopeptide repeat protein [Victivallaceae bacterium]